MANRYFYNSLTSTDLYISRKRTSYHLKSKDVQEIRKEPKTAVGDLDGTSTEDLERSLKSTLEVVFKRHKEKDEQFADIEAQLMIAEEEINQVTQDNKKLSVDYQKTIDEHKNTKQMLQQKNDQLRDLQTKFDRLADEKTEKCKEIDGLKGVLQRKENAFNRFFKEFSGKEQSCEQGEGSSREAGDVDGSSNCTICMEPWTESGEHNICSLSCGHFFGRSCITKWIKKPNRGLSTCPHCLKSASLGDLRQHYVQRICIADKKKIYADDWNISQGQPSLMASRNDDEGDNEEGDPASVDGDDGDDEGDNEEGHRANVDEGRSLEDEDFESDNEE